VSPCGELGGSRYAARGTAEVGPPASARTNSAYVPWGARLGSNQWPLLGVNKSVNKTSRIKGPGGFSDLNMPLTRCFACGPPGSRTLPAGLKVGQVAFHEYGA
jgi:hypothetical protein